LLNRRSVTVLLFLLLAVNSADASSHGMEGYSSTGCTCHGPSPGIDANVSVEGIPDEYEAGETYTLTIRLSGGPQAHSSGHQGGFNLAASDGKFNPVDSSTYLTENGEITHDHSGANQREWAVEWTAPLEEEDITFTIAGNIVDGNHEPSDGDDWALASYVSKGSDMTFGQILDYYAPMIIVILLFAVSFLMIRSSRN
jgi:hypothetical protein